MVEVNGNDTRNEATRPVADIKKRLAELNNPTINLIANAFSALAPNKPVLDDTRVTIFSELDDGRTLAQVPIQNIRVNLNVHRLNIGHMQRLINAYQHKLSGVITVSEQTNNELYIVDGFHKTVAAFLCGYTTLPAIILHGLTEQEEIKMFMAAHENTQAIRTHDHFRMSLAANDRAAMAVKAICDKYGLSTNERSNESSTDYLAGLKTAYAITKSHNNDPLWLDWALNVFDNAGWLRAYTKATSSNMLKAMDAVYGAHPKRAPLINVLRATSPEYVNALANRYHPNVDGQTALQMLLLDITWGRFTQEDLLKSIDHNGTNAN